jgi:hypothetical protein
MLMETSATFLSMPSPCGMTACWIAARRVALARTRTVFCAHQIGASHHNTGAGLAQLSQAAAHTANDGRTTLANGRLQTAAGRIGHLLLNRRLAGNASALHVPEVACAALLLAWGD